MMAISDRLYASFIGPNWNDHYRDSFARLEEAGQTGFLGSWNSAAALVPYWFAYRRLHAWAIIFFLGSLLLFAVFSTIFALFPWMRPELFLLPFVPAYLTISFVQGAVADSLLHQKALREINRVRRSAPDEASAVRSLSAMAPRGAEGGYMMHGLLMLVGVPLWGLAVVTAARILSPQYDESQNVYLALMRTALRDIAVIQETRFAESLRYTDDISALGYDAPGDLSVLVTASSDSGWSATANHPMVARPCIIFVGRVPPEYEVGEEGVPFCPESPDS